MSIKIWGAGMAGLLAAHSLRRHSPVIHEAQSELPHNHSALLRFRSNSISEVTGIPFKTVKVQKAVAWEGCVFDRCSMAMSNAYALKVTGKISGRSILNLAPVTRFIAPSNFIAQLAEGLDIQYNSPMTQPEEGVSTIPMPALMKILGWDLAATEFKARKIWTISFDIISPDVEVYQTVYVADPDNWLYRVSITGAHVIFEYIQEPTTNKFAAEYICRILEDYFGIADPEIGERKINSQTFGKLLPVDDDTRQSFILHATDAHRIYSVGRFATWRQIILDDLVKDLQIIDRMVSQRSRYASLISLHQ